MPVDNFKVAIYTLTRDRVEYTKECFASLQAKAGYSYDHYIIDNGSVDSTVSYLMGHAALFKQIVLCDENLGISKASNLALKRIFDTDSYDLIIKFDNDCLVESDGILASIVELYKQLGPFGPKYILSPKVNGIKNQPYRGASIELAGKLVGLTAIVGGLFHCVPASVYKAYTYPEMLPLAKGQDDHFCDWVKKHGGQVGYIESLAVQHFKGTDQQAKDYPDYFERKFKEEVTVI